MRVLGRTSRHFLAGLVVSFLAGLVISSVVSTGAGAQETDLALEHRLIALTDAIDAAVDRKDWAQVRGYFADRIEVSLPGQDTRSMASEELVSIWEANLYPEKTSFHLRGNHLVSVAAASATVHSHGYAWNRLEGLDGGDLWEIWGVYEHGFTRRDGRWRVSRFAFRATHQRGNERIPGYRPG